MTGRCGQAGAAGAGWVTSPAGCEVRVHAGTAVIPPAGAMASLAGADRRGSVISSSGNKMIDHDGNAAASLDEERYL